MRLKIVIYLFSFFIPSITLACSLCTTKTGTEVRAAIFNHNFLLNLFSLFLPFIFFIVIAFVIYYGLPSRSCKSSKLSDEPLEGK